MGELKQAITCQTAIKKIKNIMPCPISWLAEDA
jgi:hypothetical protein